METTLLPDDHVLVLKPLELKRFDVVVLTDPQAHETVIKRIVGRPGDTVSMVPPEARAGAEEVITGGGQLYLNGEPYDEPYATSRMPTVIAPVKLGKDDYYVLGDNRDISIDSRKYGPVKRDLISGVAYLVLYPLSRVHVIPRVATMDSSKPR